MITLAAIYAFITRYWRILAVIGGVLLILSLIVSLRGCGGSEVKINEQEIQNTQNEIQKRSDEALSNTLKKSDEVVANVTVTVKQAEEKTKQATNKNYSNTTADELKRKGNEVYK
jgi:uncharacterized membrane protein